MCASLAAAPTPRPPAGWSAAGPTSTPAWRISASPRCLSSGAPHPTGLLLHEQSAACFAAALERFEAGRQWRALGAEGQRRWAETFAPERFDARMGALLDRLWEAHARRLHQGTAPLPLELAEAVPLT